VFALSHLDEKKKKLQFLKARISHDLVKSGIWGIDNCGGYFHSTSFVKASWSYIHIIVLPINILKVWSASFLSRMTHYPVS